MTSKLKCPFCQQELREIYFNGVGVGYICPNPDCKKAEKLKGNAEFWQALIQTKQDLETISAKYAQFQKSAEIARNALKEIDMTRCIPQQTLISLGKLSKTTRFNAGNIICDATPDYIHNNLEQIEHKE